MDQVFKKVGLGDKGTVKIGGFELSKQMLVILVIVLILFLLGILPLTWMIVVLVVAFVFFNKKKEGFKSVITEDKEVLMGLGFGCLLSRLSADDQANFMSFMEPGDLKDVKEIKALFDCESAERIPLDGALELLIDENSGELDEDAVVGVGMACVLAKASPKERDEAMKEIPKEMRSKFRGFIEKAKCPGKKVNIKKAVKIAKKNKK